MEDISQSDPAAHLRVAVVPGGPSVDVVARAPRVVPPVVYLPITSGGSPIVLHEEDGRVVLPVYTALDRLLDGSGAGRPWAVTRLADLDTTLRDHGVDVIVFDLAVPLATQTAVGTAGVDAP